MKTILFLLLLLSAFSSYAQDNCPASCNIGLDERVRYTLKTHAVRTIAHDVPESYDRVRTNEWEFSRTGKLVAFRSYISKTDERDPYPELPKTVAQAPADSIFFGKDADRAFRVNYHYLNPYGIWQRSFYLSDADHRRYNEMQYAYDGDSNLIYYRSQMDYVAPLSYRALEELIRYDTLGNVTERINYLMMICEPCPSWYPQFDTARYEYIVYDHTACQKHLTSWSKHYWNEDVMHRYFFTGCDHCIGNRTGTSTETLPMEAVKPVSRKEQRKKEKFYRTHPVVTFSGDGASVSGCAYTFKVTYW